MGRMLVTGTAGFIGSHVVDHLLARGEEVVGVDCFTGNYPRAVKERNLALASRSEDFSLVEGDILDLDLEALLGGVDAVFHLAGEAGVRRSWKTGLSRYLRRNVLATERLLEAVVRDGTPGFVYASSSSVYGSSGGGPASEGSPLRPASPYGLSKVCAEDLVGMYGRERGVEATILRYFTVYGPRQRPEMAMSRFIGDALDGRSVEVFGNGGQVRDMTFVADAAAATAAALSAPPGIYNVGGGARASVARMLDAVKEVTGRPLEAVHGPEAEGDVKATWADYAKAARHLGYRPSTSLEGGVAAQVAWMLEERLASSAV